MIEDEELRITFKIASEEHLQKLDEGLLYLEKNPTDEARIGELMREAHSLKGDSGMLGVKDVATLAHQWEHLLGSVKRGENTFNSETCDRLYSGLEAIRELVREAVTGEPSNVNTFYVLAHLMGAPQQEAPKAQEPPTEIAPTEIAPTEAEPREAEPPTKPIPRESLSAPLQGQILSQESTVKAYSAEEETPTESVDSETPTITPTEESSQKAKPSELYDKPGSVPAAKKIRKEDSSPQAKEETKTKTSSPISASLPRPRAATGQRQPTFLQTPESLKQDALKQDALKQDAQPSPRQDKGEEATAPGETAAASAIQESQGSSGTYRIETIRVETQALDALMTQTGELTVTKSRLSRRLAEVEQILNLWEAWSRDAFANRFNFEEVKNRSDAGSWQKLQTFHDRLEERLEQLGSLALSLRNSVYEDSAKLDIISDELEEGIRKVRLLPLSTIFNMFPRMVRELARQQEKLVELSIVGEQTRADKRILEEMKDPLMHAIRNAIDHGIELPRERELEGKTAQANIILKGYQTASNVIIEVTDDGRGLDIDKIKQTALARGLVRQEELAMMTPNQIQSLIFSPYFSTRTFVTEVSGRGVGLDVVRANVERLKGSIQVESIPGKGTTLRFQLPTTLATAHVLLVSVNGIAYALPVEFVHTAKLVSEEDIFSIEGRDAILFEGQPISVARLGDLLELSYSGESQYYLSQTTNRPCIICQVGEERLGLLVDASIDEQDVVLKPQSKLLKRVRNVSGATILGTGEVCMVLNPYDLMKSARKQAVSDLRTETKKAVNVKKIILLAEDSIATRTQEKRILENAGYEVVAAVDGLDAFNKLKSRDFDALISDVQMPNMDGLQLTAKVREYKEYSELPIVLVTSLAKDEDKRRGAEAGANAYITKSAFNQELLLETLKRLIY